MSAGHIEFAGPARRARRTQTDGAPAPRAARLPRPVRALLGLKEIDVALADLLIFVPAALAGVGGTLLGDRAGLWIKTALTERKKG